MKQNDRQDKQELTPMQKQAVLVCTICALAVLLTAGITYGMLKRGKLEKKPTQLPSSSESNSTSQDDTNDISDHYQISETSTALLTKTSDAGTSYQDQTLFLGDSNTVRLYANGLISLQQFCAKEGIGTATALNERFVTFKRDDTLYTVAQAVAKMKPRRVVLTFGTNDTDMEVADFIRSYTALVQAIQEAYPYTDIIVNTIPPVPEDHSSYPSMEQTKIDDLNMALLTMCEELEVKFLNSAEALKDENGYGKAEYYLTGDIHLKSAGLKAMLSYLRTHAYETDDRRPDTTNIPTRAEYTNDPSSAVASSSSSAATSAKVLYEVSYRVDKEGGGSLTSGSSTEKALLNFDITDPAEEIAVTAVPDEGYIFIKWSDGVTEPTRTDRDFEEDMDLTAYFEAASIKISASGKAVVGGTYTFKATFSNSKLKTQNIRWYANGYEVDAAGKKTVKVALSQDMADEKYEIQATVTYNGTTLTSNVLEVTVSGVTSVSSSTSSTEDPASSDASSSSGSSSDSSSSSASGETTSGSSSGTTSSTASSSTSSKPSSSSSSASSEAASSSASSKPSSGSSSASSEEASSSTSSKPSSSSSSESSEAASSSASSKPSSGSSSASSEEASSSASSKPSSSSSSASSEEASDSASSKPSSEKEPSKDKEPNANRELPGKGF